MDNFEASWLKKERTGIPEGQALFLQLAGAENPVNPQRAIVRNAFLMRVESDPTPSPYDVLPLSCANRDAEQQLWPSVNKTAKGYYENRQDTLYRSQFTRFELPGK